MLLRTQVIVSRTALIALASLLAVGCAGEAPPLASPDAATAAAVSQARHITVHKTPTCGCCGDWVEHVTAEGFSVTVHEHDDLTPIRQRLGIPFQLSSCHSAEVDGYALEGHVPASDIERLLSERPDAIGLSVPGMPAGSPGMEVEGYSQPYATLLFDAQTATIFNRHNEEKSE